MNPKKNDLRTAPSIRALGWDEDWEEAAAPWAGQGFQFGRVAAEDRGSYVVWIGESEHRAEVSGRFLFTADSPSEFPKVGDWVALSVFGDTDAEVIHAVLPRRSKLARKASGETTEEQVLAANIDVIFIVQGLDHDFNLRRLERHLVMIHEGGARPAVILNKADLRKNYPDLAGTVTDLAPGIEVFPVSALTDLGLDNLSSYIREGLTYAFIGSSGVGKSTLANKLLGRSLLKTAEVRVKDSKGRHTTSRRELIRIPGGGVLIDAPGIREFGLWDAGEGLGEAYAEISAAARGCRFADCSHVHEAGCAVISAVGEGRIPRERYESYLKLRKELAYLEVRQTQSRETAARKKFKSIQRGMKTFRKIHLKSRFASDYDSDNGDRKK
jgi:ribosome biogenesis GTPase